MKLKRPYRKIVNRKKVIVLLVEIINRNLGDEVIADNAAYLAQRAFPLLAGRHYVLQRYSIQSEDFEMVKAADMVIFDGGGLIKYKQESFHTYVPDLLDCAQENGIPVYFHCVGVEGYDAGDTRCQRLAQTLNYSCVKGVTVRDDLETLRSSYLHSGQAFTAASVDTAIFTPQVYGIAKAPGAQTIGLGIVRSRIFEDYGIAEVTREFQLEMWGGVIKELEARGYQWKLFVNGLRSDYDFAVEILNYIGRAQEEEALVAPRPVESRELVETIASFAGVIACRMHANIIAYALGIPSIGLVWNEKMVFWAERIGYPQRFLRSGQFEPSLIVQRLEESMAQGVKPCSYAWKKSVAKPLKHFVRTYGAAAWKQKKRAYLPKPMDWAGKLVATALGGTRMRYAGMNGPDGLHQAIRNGFCIFEADVRLTLDHKLACVNGWSKASYEKLCVDPQAYDSKGMDLEDFLKCRMYGHFATMDLEQLFSAIQQAGDKWKLILDVGKPNKATMEVMISCLKELCQTVGSQCPAAAGALGKQGGDTGPVPAGEAGNAAKLPVRDGPVLGPLKEHLFIRLQGKQEVEAVKASGLPVQVMYYIPPKLKRDEKKLTLADIGKFCKKQGITWVSMPKEALDEAVMAFVKKEKLTVCLFSYNTYTDVLEALRMGVDWIATSYLSPEGLAAWYERACTVVFR